MSRTYRNLNRSQRNRFATRREERRRKQLEQTFNASRSSLEAARGIN